MLHTETQIFVEVEAGSSLNSVIQSLNRKVKKLKIKPCEASILVHFCDDDNKPTLSRKADAIVLAHEVAQHTQISLTKIDFSYAKPSRFQEKSEVYLTIRPERQ